MSEPYTIIVISKSLFTLHFPFILKSKKKIHRKSNLLKAVLLGFLLIFGGYQWLNLTKENNIMNKVKFIPNSNRNGYHKYQTSTVSSLSHKNKANVKHKICPMFICSACGIGNAIFQFASAYGIALHLNMTLVITKQDIFYKMFNISDSNIVIAQSRRVCNNMAVVTERYGCCSYDSRLRNLDPSKNYRIGNYLHSWKYFKGYEPYLQKQLTFRSHLKILAENVIKNITNQYNTTKSKIVTVGIHIRRGDMVWKTYKGYKVASKQYFTSAIQYFSSKFINHTLMFVIATNDVNWTTENVIYNKDHTAYKFELLRNNTPEVDFAILSNCDHVISSVGTYSWWISWIANGITTYFKWPTISNTSVGSQYNENYTDFFYPHWIGLE